MTAIGGESGSGYRHAALFYDGMPDFVASVGSFLHEGVAAGEAAMAVVSQAKIDALRAAMGDAADHVTFLDMEEVGRNPARILPVWQAFVDEHARVGRSMRGVGEPVYPERGPEELFECVRHESLLNVAFPPDAVSFSLVCPYDVSALAPDVVDEARRTHPTWGDATGWHASDAFHAVDMTAPFALALPPLPVDASAVSTLEFDGGDMRAVREAVAHHGAEAGFSEERLWDLVVAVNELASNSVRHGGGRGTLRVAVASMGASRAVVCEVVDSGFITDPLIGRVQPPFEQPNGRGHWIANQLCDLVQLHSSADGTVVRLYMRA